jgi:carboxypeptidase T
MRFTTFYCICALCFFLVQIPMSCWADPGTVPFDYDDYDSVTNIVTTLVSTNTDIAYLFSLGNTYQGRQQWIVRLTSDVDHEIPNNKPAVLFTCAIHGRERIPLQVGLSFLNYLCAHKSDASIKELLDALDIYIVPMTNPDGTMYNGCCQSVNCWRKNTKLNHDRAFESIVPANGAGIDPNRNWDYEWDFIGSGKIFQVNTYRGEQPLAAQEARAIRNFIKSHPELVVYVDWHSAVGAVLYSWNGTFDSINNAVHRNVLMALAEEVAQITGYVAQEGNQLYLSSADTGDSNEAIAGLVTLTIETEWDVNGLQPVFTCEMFTPPYPTSQTLLDIDNNVQAGIHILQVVKKGIYTSY